MRASQVGIDLIKRFEGFSSSPYNDVAGYATIGYGHRIISGENFDYITSEQAEKLLRDDIAVAENCINNGVEVDLLQNQFDALVSFVYNVGAKAFQNSTLLKLLNRGDYQGAAAQFMRWIYAGGTTQRGLIKRRKDEYALFSQAPESAS